MKPQAFIMPYGSYVKLKKILPIQVSLATIRLVCKGKIEGVCSEETASMIYKYAPQAGGIRILKRN